VSVGEEPALSREETLRRVVMLCISFARNLAYQRAMEPFMDRLQTSDFDFWVSIRGNSLDIAVLDWCKLFADEGRHHWSKVASVPPDFEAGLMDAIGMSSDEFAAYRGAVRTYRDKFVAHLDKRRVMDIPRLNVAELAVSYYHAHVVQKEAAEGVLRGLPDSPAALATYYKEAERVATIRYDRGMEPKGSMSVRLGRA